MNVTLWGVRGSIPCPGPNTVRYGGNTLCLELRWGDGNHVIVMDAGSGIRPLGSHLMKNDFPKGPLNIKMFFTHTHWDHIMGFPFFVPIFIKSTKLEIFGPVTFEDDPLDKVIGGQMQYRYFPVTMAELAAQISYHRITEGEMIFEEGLKVLTKYLNHPIACMGYRFEHLGKTIVTIYDHEPFQNLFASNPEDTDYDEEVFLEGQQAAEEENQKITQFMKNADVVIHDAQYTQKEYLAGKKGWGHSSYEWAINCAHKAGVKTLVLIHHDPERTDEQLDELSQKYQKLLGSKSSMKLVIAKEGLTL